MTEKEKQKYWRRKILRLNLSYYFALFVVYGVGGGITLSLAAFFYIAIFVPNKMSTGFGFLIGLATILWVELCLIAQRWAKKDGWGG